MTEIVAEQREVTDFRFRQLRRVRILSEEDCKFTAAGNLITSSSRFGLIFVGFHKGFKVLKLDDILSIDADKDKARIECEEYPCIKVDLQKQPVHLALSSDNMTLAVCVTKNDYPFALMYDIRSFADMACTAQPFTEVRLSATPGITVRNLTWNPSVVEMFAVCLSDGSLGIYELSDMILKINAVLPAQTNVTAVCWSPKGKQLVAGKKNGSLTQYKPTLQEAKSIAVPPLFENPVSVLEISWLIPTVFAVSFIPVGNTEDKTVSLVIISIPKGSQPNYINFGDVCLEGGDQQAPCYWMFHQPDWGILICASSKAVETAVLGCKPDNKAFWEQWVLDGSGRAELPLVKNNETYPLGLTVITSAQRQITVSDTESYPPMPILFLLSTNGLLCPFHMLNTANGATSQVNPPEILLKEGERKPKAISQPSSVFASTPVLPSSKQTMTNFTTPKSNLIEKFNQTMPGQTPLVSSCTVQQHSSVPIESGQQKPSFSYTAQQQLTVPTGDCQQKPFTLTSQQQLPVSTGGSQQKTMFVFGEGQQLPVTCSVSQQQQTFPSSLVQQKTLSESKEQWPTAPNNHTQQKTQSISDSGEQWTKVPTSNDCQVPVLSTQVNSGTVVRPLFQPSSGSSSQAVNKSMLIQDQKNSNLSFDVQNTSEKLPTLVSSNVSDVKITSTLSSTVETSNELKEREKHAAETYKAAILEEIKEFQLELTSCCKRLSKCQFEVGKKEEMGVLYEKTQEMETFCSQMKGTMESLNSDIHSLKSLTLECFAMVEEGRSRNLRNKDPKYISLLRSRDLDPFSNRRLQEIRRFQQYFETQLNEINRQLDQEWHDFLGNKKHQSRYKLQLPTIQTVYRAVTNNENLLFNLQKVVDQLTAQVKDIKINGHSSRHRPHTTLLSQFNVTSPPQFKNGNDELSALADAFLVTKLNDEDSSDKQNITQPTVKCLSPQKQAMLREVLSQRQVTSVRTTPLKDFAESRLISKLALLKKEERKTVSESTKLESPTSTTKSSLPEQESATAVSPTKPLPSCTEPTSTSQLVLATRTQPTQKEPDIPSMPVAITIQSQVQPDISAIRTISTLKEPTAAPVCLSSSLNNQVLTPVRPQVTRPTPPSTVGIEVRAPAQPTTNMQSIQIAPPAIKASPVPTTSKGFLEVSSMKSEAESSVSVPASFSVTGTLATSREHVDSTVSKPLNIATAGQPLGFSFGSVGVKTQPVITLKSVNTSEPVTTMSDKPTQCLQNKEQIPSFVKTVDTSTPVTKQVFRFSMPPTTSSTTSSPFSFGSSSGFSFKLPDSLTGGSISTGKPATLTSIPASSIVAPTPMTTSATSFTFKLPEPFTAVSDQESRTKSSEAPQSILDSSLVEENEANNKDKNETDIKVIEVSFGKSDKPDISVSSKATIPSFLSTTTASAGSAFKSILPSNVSGVKSASVSETSAFSFSLPKTQAESIAETSLTLTSDSKPVFGTTTSPATSISKPFLGSTAVPPVTISKPVFGSGTEDVRNAEKPAVCQDAGVTKSDIGNVQSIITVLTSSPSASDTSSSVSTTFANSAVSAVSLTTVPSVLTLSESNVSSSTTTASTLQSTVTTGSSLFGKPIFGQSPTFAPTFGLTTSSSSGPSFGQTTSSSGNIVFGQEASKSGFFAFVQTTNSTTSSFGQTAVSSGGNTLFGQSGSNSPSGFFGQHSTAFNQATSTSPFGQPATPSSSSSGGLFAQSGFFTGLGGKPSSENVGKNIFGVPAGNAQTSLNLFGNQQPEGFGSKSGGVFSGGSFSGGGGSVAQTGFGGFQQPPQKSPVNPGGFGGSPAFGGSPTFGGSPQFGATPNFGSQGTFGSPFGGSPSFGSGQTTGSFGSGQTSGGFGGFASMNSPTFDTLAASAQAPSFNSLTQQGQQTFGNLNQQAGAGSTGGFGSPSFGGSPGFGSQPSGFGSQDQSASAFTQWRQ
ncbi:nuclear pore complex protein Nup214-like isoform X2 [Limulus polyphemus]|uniref:Nuclear pore complex protein Nup214-like isoform X2 n=1 Tax=Limulus polyphemus TaxID=6850 RepID=A0ABM1TEW4_LIMPO|nr:nuclear pore complex protein Nup214-like isoform X2 [Limulus polyphemus]